MKEQFDINAIRLARLVLEKSRPGQLREARKLANAILGECQSDEAETASPPPSCTVNINPHIRWMIRRDMPEVLDIESHGFASPWSEEDFIRCLRQRNCIGMVSEYTEQVVGFMIYELHKTRLNLLTFAVHKDYRRASVGRAMVNKLTGKLHPERRSYISLEVRESNLPAQKFFAAMGFRATSLSEGAIRFEYRHPRAVTS